MSDQLVCKHCNSLMEASNYGISNSAGSHWSIVCHNCDTELSVYESSLGGTSYTWSIPAYVAWTESTSKDKKTIWQAGTFYSLEDAKNCHAFFYRIEKWEEDVNRQGSTRYIGLHDEYTCYFIEETKIIEELGDKFPSNYKEEPLPDTIPAYWLSIEDITRHKISQLDTGLDQDINKVLDINRYYNRSVLSNVTINMDDETIEEVSRILANKILKREYLPIVELQPGGSNSVMIN